MSKMTLNQFMKFEPTAPSKAEIHQIRTELHKYRSAKNEDQMLSFKKFLRDTTGYILKNFKIEFTDRLILVHHYYEGTQITSKTKRKDAKS